MWIELTYDEEEVMMLVVQGYSSKQIATKRQVSTRTIEGQRANVVKKLGAKNIVHAAVKFSIKNYNKIKDLQI